MSEAKRIQANAHPYGSPQEGYEDWRPVEEPWPSDAEMEFDANNEREQSSRAFGERGYAASSGS